MKEKYFNGLLILTGLLGVSSAVLIHLDSSLKLAAALAGLSGYLFLSYAEDNPPSLANMKHIKMEMNIVAEFFELLIIGSLLATSLIPQKLGIAVLASLTFLKVIVSQSNTQLSFEASEELGQGYRVYLTLAAIALSTFNTQYIYLSGFVLLGMILYDIFGVFYGVYTKKQGIKLKNRILSN